MSATAFTFYRGAAAIMASDLSQTPTTDLRTQLCGDAHLSNFGLFNGPDRRLVFDLNDFDETLPGPFEWDVKRLAASIAIAGRNNLLSPKETSRATRAAVRSYRKTMFVAAQKSPLAIHYLRLEVGEVGAGLDKKERKEAKKLIHKARRKHSVRALDKLTDIVDGQRIIVPDPPFIVRVDLDQNGPDDAEGFFEQYRSTLPYYRQVLLDRYSIIDIAHKVVGVGSVGTRCLILLLESGGGSPLFLQFKEAAASVLEPYAGSSEFEHAGERVVVGQRLMQSTGDIFLGWSRADNKDADVEHEIDFYFRQMWDGKGSIDVDEMGARHLKRYAKACGGALALGHARAGDASMISGYLGDDSTFDHAVAAFSESYADLNELDHGLHLSAIESGQLEAVLDL